jgi:hypothetical protein
VVPTVAHPDLRLLRHDCPPQGLQAFARSRGLQRVAPVASGAANGCVGGAPWPLNVA